MNLARGALIFPVGALFARLANNADFASNRLPRSYWFSAQDQKKGNYMKFMLMFSWKPDKKNQDEGIARFKKTGGLPPKGVKLLGRWTRADFSAGYDLLESDDPGALAEFALRWSDLMEISIVPVVDDQELLEALKRAGK